MGLVKFERIVTYDGPQPGGCSGGVCPAIFKGDDGNYYIQGKIVDNSTKSQVPVANDEDIVRIPKALLSDFLSKGSI